MEEELRRVVERAKDAKKKSRDPSPEPEILIARDLAERVENLTGVKVAERIRELERERSREATAFLVGKEVAEGRFFPDKKLRLIEHGIRVSLAIITGGVVAAPIDGIVGVKDGRNDDGGRYLRVLYAGPIRSAGGTAQALSVLSADYIRRGLGFDRYIPRDDEIERVVEETFLYKRIASLQYTPPDDDIRTIVKNCPICIDGEPTEREEVERYRDLPRIETNRIRGGMALVLAEGVAQKARKLRKFVQEWGELSDEWKWLEKLSREGEGEKLKITPSESYLKDLVAGRPVLAHPSRPGAFRLRYGRSRNTGLAAVGIHPATMILLDGFIAPGTQLKLERPGKAACVCPVDSIEGPWVRLKNGDFLMVCSAEEAERIREDVAYIFDLGEILISYGDFLENNYPLLPGSYCEEWWILEGGKKKASYPEILELAENGVPLHPSYTYLWNDISMEDYGILSEYTEKNGRIKNGTLLLPFDEKIKEILEKLLVRHRIRDFIEIDEPIPLMRCLGLNEDLKRKREKKVKAKNPLEAACIASGFLIRERTPTRIGARMGRPEKSKPRKMKPPPHVLFPLGESGGRARLFLDAVRKGKIEVEVGERYCKRCKRERWEILCECGERTIPLYRCCNISFFSPTCPKCQRGASSGKRRTIDVRRMYEKALLCVGERGSKKLKGVHGLISKERTPEPIEKGILREKHGVWVFKDGTIRFDQTNLPLTHFIPREIGTSVEKLKELGYSYDMDGFPLEREDQVVELRPQDIIISEGAGEYLLNASKFLDELLVKYYKESPYYNASSKEDLIGHLVIGLAPHTSAGVLGRIIGFTTALACYAHPFFYAAKRRNADGEEDSIILLLDGLLNFSRSYLPEKRGGSMDAPLVLTTKIDVREIDPEAHNLDRGESYPLDFYNATKRYARPKEVEVEVVGKKLGTEEEEKGIKFTHPTSHIASGPGATAYTELESMVEKLDAQLSLAKKIRAVDASDVAERVINLHFIKDLMGNLRAYATQQVRCTNCNAKYRRPTLSGRCTKCGSNLMPTVHEGTVRKYLEASLTVAQEYEISKYTRQRLRLLEAEIDSLFPKVELGDFSNRRLGNKIGVT